MAEPEVTSSEINDACWAFIEAMPHVLPGPIHNDLKPALHAAICEYLKRSRLCLTTPDQPPATPQAVPSLKLHALEAADALSKYAAAPFFPDVERRGVVRATTAEWWDGLAEQIESSQALIFRAMDGYRSTSMTRAALQAGEAEPRAPRAFRIPEPGTPWWQTAKDCGAWTDRKDGDVGYVHFGSIEALRVYTMKVCRQAEAAALELQPMSRERCHADRDGDCRHVDCPQLRDGEPRATGRHCPLDLSDSAHGTGTDKENL